jgi:hypothetical protein
MATSSTNFDSDGNVVLILNSAIISTPDSAEDTDSTSIASVKGVCKSLTLCSTPDEIRYCFFPGTDGSFAGIYYNAKKLENYRREITSNYKPSEGVRQQLSRANGELTKSCTRQMSLLSSS